MKDAIALNKITALAFNRSIELALRNPPDVEASLDRIRRAINSLPDGKLYASVQSNRVTFYTLRNGHQKYLSKRSKMIHPLARKTYLLLLQEILELTDSDKPADALKRHALIGKLQKLISTYERGNLELARIVLTNNQYRWFTGTFKQKSIDEAKAFKASCGIPVRSKSERDIINANENLAVPFHYEEQQIIYVQPLVDQLRDKLKRSGFLSREYSDGQLFRFYHGTIHWNVPAELAWMNARGSIWKSYEPRSGTIMIFNDIQVLLADSTLFIWEHEGMMDDFFYRCHATERTAVMKITKTVSKENLLETFEDEIDSPEKLIDIIEKYVLPRLWF